MNMMFNDVNMNDPIGIVVMKNLNMSLILRKNGLRNCMLSMVMLFLVACDSSSEFGGNSLGSSGTKVAVQGDGTTLAAIRQRGHIRCGVSTSLPGFSAPDSQGHWSGLDVDFCRVLSAAIFADPSRIVFIPLNAKERFDALQAGEIDILSRNTSWTYTRDIPQHLNFVGITFYDGQGFLVRVDSGINTPEDLNGTAICVKGNTTSEQNLVAYFRQRNMIYQPVIFDTSDQSLSGFEAGRCSALSADRSALAAMRLNLKTPGSAELLPMVISKEPLGPVIREGDNQWHKITRWTFFAILNAEEFGITSKNIDSFKYSNNPMISRLMGEEDSLGQNLGLDNLWAYYAIKLVGNYGEIFERNLGMNSPIKINRGVNNLWTNGGLQYGPPLR